ncbi:hypothetical protein CBF27_04585, partial [Vagococcus acidifermentans]
MDKATDDLAEALKNLVPKTAVDNKVSKDLLRDVIKKSSGLKEDDYTVSSWAPFQSKLQKAQSVLKDEDATQAEVDKAANELVKALSGLVIKPAVDNKVNKDLLKQAIGMGDTLREDDYTVSSWAPFQSKLQKAQSVLKDEDATQAEVDKAANELVKALSGLVIKPAVDNKVNKDLLKQAIGMGDTLREDDYTVSSWAPFQSK